MLGEDYEDEIEPKKQQNHPKSKTSDAKKKKSKKKKEKEKTQQIEQIEEVEPVKPPQQKETKRHSFPICENCKNLKIKIKELEQLNEELLKIKDKLYKTNEELLIQKEEILSKKNELETTNKQLERKNNELSQKITELNEEKDGYKDEITGLKKQLMAKVNELNNLSKEKNTNKNTTSILPNIVSNNNIKKEENKNTDNTSLSDSIPPKKEEEKNNINNNNYVNIEEFNDLKKIVENLRNRIYAIENWKQNLDNLNDTNNQNEEKTNSLNVSEKKEKYISKNSVDETSNENTLKSLVYNEVTLTDKKNLNQIIYENMDQLSKSMVIDARQKIIPEDFSNTSRRNNKPRMPTSFSKKEIHDRPKTPDMRKNQKQKFNSLIITDVEDLDLIARGLVKDNMDSLKNLRVGYKLIYRASEHGSRAEDFHKKVDNIFSTLTVIKTKGDLIFGGYTSLSWRGDEESEKKDDKSFVFSINLEKLYFENGKNDYSIICEKNKGPCFVGMFTIQDKILGVKEYVNPWGMQSYAGETSNYEINGGKSYFVVEEMGIYFIIDLKC